MILNNKSSQKINPATEEKQDAIIAALGGIPENENANIDDLISAVAADFATLLTKLTDHSQLTQVVKSDGTPIDFMAEFTALKAKLTDATQKTQLVDAAGLVVYPSGKPIVLAGSVTIPSNASSYAAGDAVNDSATVPTSISFDVDAAINNGGGGVIGLIKVMAASQFAGKTINVAVYKDVPSGIVGDNGAFVIDAANNAKRIAIIPVLMDAVLGASTICFGQVSVFIPYQTLSTGKTIKALLFTSDAVTSPTVSSAITVMLTTVQIA